MTMLALRRPPNYNGITLDPQIDWDVDDLVSELNALELRLSGGSSSAPARLWKKEPKDLTKKKLGSSLGKGFVMRLDDDAENIEDNDAGVSNDTMEVRKGTRFTCVDLDFSEDSDDEIDSALVRSYLTSKPGVSESTLFELKRENQLLIKEDIRNTLTALEERWRQECEKSASAYGRVEKYINDRKEKDKRHHTLYRRRIAEEVDHHLSAIQRDHEQLSRMEEKKLAEIEEKEKALIEDKNWKEKEEELKDAKAAEEAQKAYLESQRKAALEADERKVNKTQKAREERPTGIMKSLEITSKGIYVKASEAALKLEEKKLEVYGKFEEANNKFSPEMRKALQSFERQIARRIKQISGNQDNIRLKVNNLLNIIKDTRCPQSISLAAFAKQIVAVCENPSVSLARTAFACGQVVVAITSEFPLAMELILAEFHRACIYTVPKHIRFSEATFGTKEAYLMKIGYREEDGKIESRAQFLERVEAYVTLYAALLQTQVHGLKNCHGLEAGWSWLARLLNNLPADMATATALFAFLKMAGFALHVKYKTQFRKLLNTVAREFIVALKSVGDAQMSPVITAIETYIDTKEFLNEPEGWRLGAQLISREASKETVGHFY